MYWEAVSEHLAAKGMTVSVVNPAQIKAFGQSQLVHTKIAMLGQHRICVGDARFELEAEVYSCKAH